MTAPAIILARPQMGENIGAAARAMHNFGLSDLRLVAPRDGWPNEAARSMAAHAVGIVDNARVFADARAAVADLSFVAAATARVRGMDKPVLLPEELGNMMKSLPPRGGVQERAARLGGGGGTPHDSSAAKGLASSAPPQGGSGVLFGPERSGLDNEEIAESDAILTIPTAPENPSLNLAQAVAVVAYEWFRQNPLPAGEGGASAPGEGHTTPRSQPLTPALSRGEREQPAPKSELHGLFDQLEAALDAADYWREPEKKPVMWRNLRSLLIRAGMNSQEVRSLRGMVRALAEGGGNQYPVPRNQKRRRQT